MSSTDTQMFGEFLVKSWTSLSSLLVNGWTVEAGGPNFEYRVTNGIKVDLRGGLIPPTIVLGKQLICTFPSALWPPFIINFIVPMGLSGTRLTLNTDGTLVYQGITTGFSTIYLNSQDFWLN